MVVLRCPYCGKKIRPNENFCSHCGKEIDKPHIDDVDTAFQDVGSIMFKLIGIVILWFIMLIIVGLIGNVLGFPSYSPVLFILSFVVTGFIVVLYWLKK